MAILITGSNGLLGQKIVRQLLKKKVPFIASSKGENRNPDCPSDNYQSLDITQKAEINNVINQHNITAIINTAAMTNVDACEADNENCQKINVEAVNYLFEACINNRIYFVQLSTDFVFDGENGLYAEDDERNPLSVYAKSKTDAEDILLQNEYKKWSILRTIIVFGQGNNLSRSNIVLWAKEALHENKPLTIVEDQFRAPTWADDLAWACIKVVENEAKGIYHISGPRNCFSV